MKKLLFVILFLPFVLNAQNQESNNDFYRAKKGNLYFYWGWNWEWFTKSDIHFQGTNYDFTLNDVVANDRPSKFGFNPYFHPGFVTLPQYNFRVGYFFKDNWDISFGIDHMKYVMQQNQTVDIEGNIANSNTIYDGTYVNDKIVLEEDFLKFEHTDGLNYINFELRHSDPFFKYRSIQLSAIEGVGAGVLVPKTNTTLLNNPRYDEFHLAGFGLGAVVGLNVNFLKYFFIQTELKGGFISMPDIRTTASKSDKANQHFFFSELDILFGGIIRLK